MNISIHQQTAHRIAAYLGTQAGEIIRLEEWANCYYVQVRGERPTFVSKSIVLPVIPLWSLNQLHSGLPWQRQETKRYIKERIAGHKSIVELCEWWGWELDIDEYGWTIEGNYTSVYYERLESVILARLADAPTRIEPAIAIAA